MYDSLTVGSSYGKACEADLLPRTAAGEAYMSPSRP